jgi:hypothetical protein
MGLAAIFGNVSLQSDKRALERGELLMFVNPLLSLGILELPIVKKPLLFPY